MISHRENMMKIREERWKNLLEEYSFLEITQRDFCKTKNVEYSKFLYWKRRLNFRVHIKRQETKIKHWKRILQEWKETNLTQKQFCQEKNLAYSDFKYWRRRFFPHEIQKNVIKTKQEWTQLIKEWEESDLNKTQFCNKKRIGVHSLNYWIRKKRKGQLK